MVTIHPQFITDKAGKKISAILPMKEFKAVLEELENMDDLRRYEEAKKANEPAYPIDVAFKMIEAKRKKIKHGV